MKQIYTTNYSAAAKMDRNRFYLVATNATVPQGVEVDEKWTIVAPSWNTITKPFKDGQIDAAEYAKRYQEQLQSNKDQIKAELYYLVQRADKAGHKYVVLLGYNVANGVSFLQLLAKHISFNNAISVEEWGQKREIAPSAPKDRFKPCVVLVENSYDGKLVEYKGNNKEIHLSSPYAYISHIYDLLKQKNEHYTMTLYADPLDNRLLHKAVIAYGRRRLTYTNVNADKKRLAPRSDDQYLTYRIEQRHTTIWHVATTQEPAKWATEKHNIWIGQGDKGNYDPNKSKWEQKLTKDGKILISGKYWHKKDFRTLEYTSEYKGKRLLITITVVETNIFTRTIEPNHQFTQEDGSVKQTINAGKWVRNAKERAAISGWTGECNLRVDRNGHLRIYGQWQKSWQVGTSTNAQQHFMTQHWSNDTIEREKSIDTGYTPTIKKTFTTFATENSPTRDKHGRFIKKATPMQTTTTRTIRTFCQDTDTHVPEQKRDLRKEQHRAIQNEYRQYNRDMRLWDRIQLVALEIEHLKNENKKKKLSKPENAAKLWLQKTKREQPQWLNASNATMLINYAVENLKKGVWVGTQASKFCEENAK